MLALYSKITKQKRCIILNFGKKSRFLFTLLQFLDEKHRTAIGFVANFTRSFDIFVYIHTFVD